RLKPVEHELLVERTIIALGYAPFVIVIRDIERVCAGPWTATRCRLAAHARAWATGTAKHAKAGRRRAILTPPAVSVLALAKASSAPSRRVNARHAGWPS